MPHTRACHVDCPHLPKSPVRPQTVVRCFIPQVNLSRARYILKQQSSLKSYLPGWCVALIIQGAAIWGSRPLHSGAVILEDSPSGLLHSVIFDRGSLALALLPNTRPFRAHIVQTFRVTHNHARNEIAAYTVAPALKPPPLAATQGTVGGLQALKSGGSYCKKGTQSCCASCCFPVCAFVRLCVL